jgi:hypothetical protein
MPETAVKKRKILIIGDSHVHAIQSGLQELVPKRDDLDISALRIMIERGEKQGAGDVAFDDAMVMASSLSDGDVLATAFRGNQHNALGLMQHPQPFDIMMPGIAPLIPGETEIIPLAMARQFFSETLRGGYGKMILRARAACKVRMACLSPPAPKEDNEHIQKGAETYFREAGIAEIGVSPPALRLKLWTLQDEALAQFCAENDIIHLANPPGSRDENGYLKRDYYFRDATHGNAAYGTLVVNQLIDLAGACGEAASGR